VGVSFEGAAAVLGSNRCGVLFRRNGGVLGDRTEFQKVNEERRKRGCMA